jgi:hypothetical protein
MIDAGDDVSCSFEFRFLVDRALAAREAGRHDVADVFSRAAEGLLIAALPDVASDVAMVASRKGVGGDLAQRMANRLSGATAAAVSLVWLLRGARQPAVRALSEAFRRDPLFRDTIIALCGRLFRFGNELRV